MTLHRELLSCQSRGGIGHQIAIKNLRFYMDQTPYVTLKAEMEAIGDIALLKYMQEAGVRSPLWGDYLSHLQELGARQGE